MDDERRRKIEAGKSKWAEFKKKKSRSAKSISPPKVIPSHVHEKSCPVDPGGTSSVLTTSPVHTSEQLQSEKEFVPEVSFVRSISKEQLDTTNNNAFSVMDSSPLLGNIESQPDLPPVNILTLHQPQCSNFDSQHDLSPESVNAIPDIQSLQESNSIESFTSESTADQSESSSSDISTVTGFSSNSSKSGFITENESPKKPIPTPTDHPEDEKDNRPDEEKTFESIPTEEKEKDVLVEEILVSKESMLDTVLSVSEKISLGKESESKPCDMLHIERDKPVITEVAEDTKSHFSENISTSLSSLLSLTGQADDESSAFLNADDTHFSSLLDHYEQKIKKYQEAIQKRDSVIHKLSKTLETSMNANQAAHSDGNTQVEMLKEEINLLQLKMKETAELLKTQKLKNGNLEFENCACQTEDLQLFKCDTAIQVETSFSSLLQSCDLNESSFLELFVKKICTNPDSLHHMIQKLGELLATHFSHTHIKELVTLLRNEVGVQSDVLEITNSSSTTTISDTQSLEKIDTSTILKKIASLNMVAKLIESLVSISSGNVNTFSDFSPSKFQSFFLRRLHSMESGDILPDMSESESVISDINYAEVETPGNKQPVIDATSPVERLRQKNLSEDFSLVTDFLEDEMDRIRSFLPVSSGPQGDGLEISEKVEEKECASEIFEMVVETDQQKILLQASKLETRLKNLKLLDKELHNIQQFSHRLSLDSDTMTLSEDNIMMEELPLSCVSLLSLTDSEYKGDNILTDSETNFSRKVSLDMTRSMQEREFCARCEINVDMLKEKYENDIMNLKDQFEKSHSAQKKGLLESIKKLKSDVFDLKTGKENLKLEFSKQIDLLCSENALRLKQLSQKCNEELSQIKFSRNELLLEKDELEIKLKELQQKLVFSDQKFRDVLDEKSQNEIVLQNQIADLIQEHEQDLDMIRLDNETKLNQEKKHLDDNYLTLIETMKKAHEEEINNLRLQIKREFEEREQNFLNEHSKTISMIEAAHCDESAVYQKKIEQLLEEKCDLLSKTTQEYEAMLNKNHRALEILCKRLLSKIRTEKERILNESSKSGVDLDVSLSAFEHLNNSLENGLLRFLNQNYFVNANNEEFLPDDTEYLPIEMSFPLGDEDIPPISKMKQSAHASKKGDEKNGSRSSLESRAESRAAPSESSLDSDDLFTIHTELNRLQEEFQKDVAFYKDINDQLHEEIKSLRQQNQELEDQKRNLEVRVQEKDKEIAAKESMLIDIDAAAVKGGSQLSASDIRSWQVQAAQTNSRLLHVLSDLVKTFLDIEQEINAHLLEYGLIPSRNGALNHHDDDTGQSVGSREDFASLSLGECPNLELTEDGPDLTPRACDVFIPSGNYDTDLEGEDVVLGASRRLRLAVDHVLNLLGRAVENQQSQDLKLLLKRNEELSLELQEESQGRDAVNMELVSAESTIRRLESEKQRLEDQNRDLQDDYEMLKRELNIEKSKVSHLQQEKECALDEIHTLKEQCELLASRLGDPGKTENDIMLSPSGTCLHENSELLEENSRLSSEKQTVQKSLSKERQSYLDRLHQMEIAIEELNVEKDNLMEQKCKEIRDLKAEMDAMEKQLQSNRKFIEQQALEREQEREDFMNQINRMEEFVKEKERIQSSESQMTREIESLEELLRARIEDHKNAMAKKDEVEKELRQSVDKIRDLREVIDELEKQLDIKSRIEVELRQKLSTIYESIPNQDKSGSLSDSGDSSKHAQANRESMEHLHNLKEQLASQSQDIEMMSQSQTLLHELRGQIHFLEAKVEQRARQLESSFLSAASSPVQSGATSPSESQDSESLQMQCEEGWEMSPRSVHWLEIRRLEEKIGRLAHIDEELLKKNKDLEQQLKKMKASYCECQHENSALQEKVSEQLVQISALKSHIDEQKHRCSTPQKTHPFAEKIEDLQEKLEKQIEKNKKLISDLQEAESTVCTLQEEAYKKDEMIAAIQKTVEDKMKQSTDEEESDFSTIEDFKNQLAEKIKLVEAIEKENEDLRSDIEYLKTENSSLKSLLEKAEKEVETERAQVDSLCEEMANLTENAREGISNNKTNNSETNETSLSEETQDHLSKLTDMQNRLKAKNLELLMLKATVTKLESSLRVSEKQLEYEKVLVETLQQELGSLTSYQKKLEQDFNTVQDMMQQKERELATLHEETESQMKLEAEIETLEKKLSYQKDVELELRKKVEEFENRLNEADNLRKELDNKDSYIQTLTENHKKELHDLKKQIAVLKNFKSLTENEIDIQELVKKIMEASDAFKPDETHALQGVLISMLRNCLDSILNQMKQQHEEHIKSINKSWQEKISEEIENKQKAFKSEMDKFSFEKEKIRTETDAFWQEKIKEIEIMLKNEEEKSKEISENAKATTMELQEMYTGKIAALKQNLDCALKEKRSLEMTVEVLNAEIQKLRQIEKARDNNFSINYDSKLSAVSKTIQESFEKEKNRLQMELNAKLEQEKEMKLKHQKELADIHKYFEARWATEMKKVKDSQTEDLRQIKINNEKMLEEKIRNAKEEYLVDIAEERKQELKKHKEELASLRAKYEKEKKSLVVEKEKAVKEAIDVLEKKFNENLEEIQKNLSSSSHSKISEEQKKWEEEKLKLMTAHRKQLSALKQELKDRYQKQLQAQSVAHSEEMKRLEETYNRKVEEVHDMIKDAKRAASKTGYSDSGSCRTTTPSSDMTSSDEACSSCQEDMLSANKHILVDKIHQDGKRVLSLIESSSQPYASVKEAHLWLEERKWIVNRLKSVAPATSNGNLKTVIMDLVDEIQKFRMNFEAALDENSELKQKYEDLEQHLSTQYSKIRDISAQLKKQKAANLELESLLSFKTSEISDLKKQLSEASRLVQLAAEKEANSRNNESVRSSSYESGCLRSADNPKSADKFSLFLPEIDNSSSLNQRTLSNKVSYTQELPPIPKFDTPPLFLTQNDSLPDTTDNMKNEMLNVNEKLLSVFNKGIDPTDAKLHGLYWVFRRSQSYNKALIYQKKYLLMLLMGFQGTEKVTLAWLKCMNSSNNASTPSSDVTITDSPLHPKSRFRAAVFVIIALERMKFYVRRWRLLARIPSSQVIDIEIQSVFQNYSFLSPATSPGYQHSSQSLSSVPLSTAGRDFKSSQMSTSSRVENKSKNSANPDRSKLIEYVHRLEILQKQLGLDSLR